MLKEILAIVKKAEAWFYGFPEAERKNFISLELSLKLAQYILQKEGSIAPSPPPTLKPLTYQEARDKGYLTVPEYTADKCISDSHLRKLIRDNQIYVVRDGKKPALVDANDMIKVIKTCAAYRARMAKGIFERAPIPEGEEDSLDIDY